MCSEPSPTVESRLRPVTTEHTITMNGKIVILSAPSGTGKSTIIRHLMASRPDLRLEFSVSCTSRSPRAGEVDGREYYFLSPEEFSHKVERGEFVEWEEVYPGTCYGTLVSEVERVVDAGGTLIMDIDVKGGVNVKSRFGRRALAIFVQPPSRDELEKRLRGRATDSEETILRRLAKAELEMSYAKDYDVCVVNDRLERAAEEVGRLIDNFHPEKE